MVGSLIRKPQQPDHTALLEIWLAASRTGHAFLGEEVLQDQMAKVRDLYLPHADNWVAEDRGQIIGFIGLLGNHIGGLFVSPAEHRRGVGHMLIEQVAAPLGEVTVEVYEQNSSAVAFYDRCGFSVIARKELDDEGRPFALLRMLRAANA